MILLNLVLLIYGKRSCRVSDRSSQIGLNVDGPEKGAAFGRQGFEQFGMRLPLAESRGTLNSDRISPLHRRTDLDRAWLNSFPLPSPEFDSVTKRIVEIGVRCTIGVVDGTINLHTGIYQFATQPVHIGQVDLKNEVGGDVPNLQRILMAQFKDIPSLELYQRLKTIREAAGKWDAELKQKLLIHLEQGGGYGGNLLLAQIYVADGDYDKALALTQRNIGEEALNHIAEGITSTYPEKAISIYKRLVDDCLAVNGRDRYRAAAQFAAKIKKAYLDILEDEAAWNNYIRGIRFENRRRSALIDEFKQL